MKTLYLDTSYNLFDNETSFRSLVEGFLGMKETLIELEWVLYQNKITDFGFENIAAAIG